MLVVFQITLGMDFLWILVEIWLQVGVQNGAKIDIKGGWKNDEKMMMVRMAKKLDIGGYGCARHHHSRPQGRYSLKGGVNPSSPHGVTVATQVG